MSVIASLVTIAGLLPLVLLTVVAVYSYSQIRFLSLPISASLGIFTIVLAFITGISIFLVYSLIRRSSKNERHQLAVPLIGVFGFQLICDTVVTTLALTYMLPPASLPCGLEIRWQKLYSNNNESAIKAIQDAFNCCGFHSPKDRAWPFGQPSSCGEIFGRNKSCLGEWRKAEQINAGLIVFVALLGFAIKALSIIPLLTSSSWIQGLTHPFQHRSRDHEDVLEQGHQAVTTRLIDEGNMGEQYRDEPGNPRLPINAPNENGQNEEPGVEPSELLDHGNEWRRSELDTP